MTKALDTLFVKDAAESAFTEFENFIKFRRPGDMSIKDYLIEFNLRLNKIKTHKMELPDGVVAYYLLDCANLTQEQASLCRATCSKLGYAEMKTQIERVSISPNTGTSTQTRSSLNSSLSRMLMIMNKTTMMIMIMRQMMLRRPTSLDPPLDQRHLLSALPHNRTAKRTHLMNLDTPPHVAIANPYSTRSTTTLN